MFLYAGSLAPPDTTGDVSSQTRGVLERARTTLERAGSSLDQALSVLVFLKSASDFQAMNAVYSGFWSKDYPTRTTVVVPPVTPGGMVEMSLVAAGPGADREVIHPADWLRSPSPYSYAIRSGDTVFLSGLVARNGRDNSAVAGDVGVQTRVILDNAGELLHAAGLTHSHIAASRIYLPDIGSFAPMNVAYRTYFPSQPPARATVRADLAGPQYSVEITFTASAAPRRALSSNAYPGLPLSSGIVAGRAVYLSGMLGFDESNKTDAAAQARATLAKLGRSLAEAGASPADVVEAIVYVTDRRFLADVDREYDAFFGSHTPARTNIVCGLMAPDGLVEIMLMAELPESP
jgi:enamine deaminase RidA (YjgF/YER057c/UK114 family)